MGKGSSWLLLVTTSLLVLSLAVVAGCGGGGGGNGGNGDNGGNGEVETTGNVSGQVLCYGAGVADVVVTVGGKNGVSDSSGDFVITGITEGDGQLVTVQPPGSYVLASDEPIYINVVADQTTNCV